jgi:hypothetical protein
VSTVKYNSTQRVNNNWYFTCTVISTILICSLSSSFAICDNTLHIVKAVNTQEDSYSENFNIAWIKKNYCHYCIQDLNQTAEKKNTPNEIIILPPSLENSNQWSSITKKTNDDLYDVKIGWNSAYLNSGKNTILLLSFLNHKTNLEEKQIEYSFKAIYPGANFTIKDVKHQKAPTGTGVQIVKLSMLGQLNILVDFTTTFSEQQLNKINTRNNIDSTVSNKSENVSFSIRIQSKDVPSINSPNTRI